MTMKNDSKVEEELTCQLKIDMKNLSNFHQSSQESQKFALCGMLLPKGYNA